MNAVIYDPLEEYENRLQALHLENTNAFLEQLVVRSGINVEENRKTVAQYNDHTANLKKLKRKLNWLRFLRVLMCITLVLIPLVIWKTTPAIRALRREMEEADQKADALLALAQQQMEPLNRLFTDRDALDIIHSTVPLLSFHTYFSAAHEANMEINYDFRDGDDHEQSTVDVLAGQYNENPFLFENKVIHTMGTETYHGYKTITWTETYRDMDGKLRRRTRSETLHASVVKPKPFYNTQVVLRYCAQGGPELSFTRDATHLEQKSERAIERYVKKGEKKLRKMSEKAVKENDDFTSMSNTEFEVLFDALDRTDEVQFRTLFTPLAQTNMVSLLLSQTGYGDDFNFIKQKRTNTIISQHSQGRTIKLFPGVYGSYAFDTIKENFVRENTSFFKAVYFDFAPLLAIPLYQERPVHSLKPIPDYGRLSSQKECEALANTMDQAYVVHPNTKTRAILKSAYIGTENKTDEVCITAYSYDIEPRVDIVPVWGGDGRMHNVHVHWDNYLPLVNQRNFFVTENTTDQAFLASRNGLGIFGSKI